MVAFSVSAHSFASRLLANSTHPSSKFRFLFPPYFTLRAWDLGSSGARKIRLIGPKRVRRDCTFAGFMNGGTRLR